ncbi:MAG: RdgB/HAM1 family non-canonical purine pyrophosphatase [Cyanobacteriota bacterium]|jgi:non-canonical purine NTP pyrophosphatase (RdgB/HAM1 family)
MGPIPSIRTVRQAPAPPLPAVRQAARPVLVIASGNSHKVAEISAMLDAVDLLVDRQPEGLEIEETGATYLENARLKAETVARLTGHWALADDSGLEVDALGGAPGLYSARYAPTDHERIHRLLQELGPTPYRSASFNSAMVLADPSGRTALEAEGICRGEILTAPDGHGGGYDPIFWVREAGMSYARMGPHLRNRLGSRGKAARNLAPGLKRLLGLAP